MMPNKTYELRKLYAEQSRYSLPQVKPYYPLFLQWPQKSYFEKFRFDAKLLQSAFSKPNPDSYKTIAERVFGDQKQIQYTNLKHTSNLFYERCKLHKQHLDEIEHSHIKTQEELFGVKINNIPENARRLSSLEGLLLQLDQQRRDEELAFWKDTVELREKLFEGAGEYSAAKNRYSIFSGVEVFGDAGKY
ncbi:MAG: hypothetical protein PHF37_01810 [Phycisphaerae bacterium]|nr:hypothetical protein [Phycisphaerae bacterium]